jgi:phosphoglycerate dehydrogenase-like enzyme
MSMNIVVNLARSDKGDKDFYSRWELYGKVYSYIPQNKYELQSVKVLVVDQYTSIDKKFISLFPNLKVVATPTTGLTHIKEDLHIPVISLKGDRAFLNKITSVSEFVTMSILKLAKDISDPPIKVSGKTLGIIGMGRLGKLVKRAGKGLGMDILYYEKGMKEHALDYLLWKSDFITIHCDENPTSKGLLSEEKLKLIRPTSFLINTSRASILDEQALLRSLKTGKIKGAALDTTNLKFSALYEPAPWNLIVTPHIAGRSIEDRISTCEYLVNKVGDSGYTL